MSYILFLSDNSQIFCKIMTMPQSTGGICLNIMRYNSDIEILIINTNTYNQSAHLEQSKYLESLHILRINLHTQNQSAYLK